MNPSLLDKEDWITSTLHSSDIFFVRPGFNFLTSGTFPTQIHVAEATEIGNEMLLRIHAEFFNDTGETLKGTLLISPDWRPGSPFWKLLKIGDCFPRIGEKVNLSGLLGLTVLTTLEIIPDNGREYVNIVDVALPTHQR